MDAWPAPTTTSTFPQTDNYTDVGFDTQYQYQGDNYWVTLRGSFIHEFQNLNASFANGLAANPTNNLNEARAYASLAYGNDNRIVLTGQYFTSWGSPDAILYGGSPNSNGWIAEIAYIPFISSQAPGWPWFNAAPRAAIHLVQRIQRNHRRRQRQQHAVPLSVGGDVAGSARWFGDVR